MASTKKTFVAIAAVLKNLRPPLEKAKSGQYDFAWGQTSALNAAAHSIDTIFANENPSFDRARFLAACGVKPSHDTKHLAAHQNNLNAAQREIDSREAQGEDMSSAHIDPVTYAIVKSGATA